jgi:tetraacyldisaccharide 4'-kinase
MASGVEAIVRRAWAGETPAARLLRAGLVPPALVYGRIVALRNRLYDTGWLAAARVQARVVSVGNLTVGGTGKTPAVLWVATHLAARGRRVAIVARGYGKRRPGVVVVSEAGRALVPPEEGGDEAVMLAARFPGPIVTAERRADAARVACDRFGAEVVVLDDGFQHRALARDADLVLLADEPSELLLPAGPGREPATSLARAAAVLCMGERESPGGIPAFRGRLRATDLVDPAGRVEGPAASLAGAEVAVVAGVARPERVAATVAALGATVRETVAFPDHHAYARDDLPRLAAAARRSRLVTTEKDLVKLARLPGAPPMVAVRVDLEVENGEELLALLGGTGRPAPSGFAGG